jgi:hypothetical protein
MKQTATEFLFEKLWETPKDKLTWNAILEQAKEMDKKQMCQFAFDYNDEFINNGEVPTIEQYYKETYDK